MPNTSKNRALIIARSLGYQFDDGETLFHDLNFTLDRTITALIGRNGTGKSVLAELLSGDRLCTSGGISRLGSVAYFKQLTNPEDYSAMTLADYLGVTDTLAALQRVMAGQCLAEDFELIDNDWQLSEHLNQGLKALNISAVLSDTCSRLSGGQLVRLQLWKLFRERADLLILDEPSNHLDAKGRDWLLGEIKSYSGGILLISHDSRLLPVASQFLKLSDGALSSFQGAWQDFLQQQHVASENLAKKQSVLEKQVKQLERRQKLTCEKSERRAKQGKKLRDGSQPKVLLDAKKESAQSSQSSLVIQHKRQRDQIRSELKSIKEQRESVPSISMSLAGSIKAKKRLLTLSNVVLPRGAVGPISRVINYGDKLHVRGCNGAGKTTLFELLLGKIDLRSGDIQGNISCFYLDQHYSQFNNPRTVLENFIQLQGCTDEGRARTLLASIGFTRERVNLPVSQCSGGEKMKLAMLVISQRGALSESGTLLLLDEPDNHLDLESKQLLAQALSDYAGSYLMVSHDEDLVLAAGCNGYLQL